MEIATSLAQVGDLNCRIMDCLGDKKPKLLAFLCHGFGATGSDLVGIGEALLRTLLPLQESVRFVFPEAPLSLDHLGMPGSRAWWMIDMMALNQAMITGEFRDFENTRPEGIDDAHNLLRNTIDTLLKEYDMNYDQLLLGGFSQGAMLSTEVTLNLPQNPAGLCVFSGTLLDQDNWKSLMSKYKGLKVFQSHGQQDSILPFSLAEKLKDMMIAQGLEVNFFPFMGMHEIPEPALAGYVQLLTSLLKN